MRENTLERMVCVCQKGLYICWREIAALWYIVAVRLLAAAVI